jgi:hypothetical protein
VEPRARTNPTDPMTLPTMMAASNRSFLSSRAFMPLPSRARHTRAQFAARPTFEYSLRGLIERLAHGDMAMAMFGCSIPRLAEAAQVTVVLLTKFGVRFIGQGQHIFLHAPPYFGFADRLM